jgi:hypothetical protein
VDSNYKVVESTSVKPHLVALLKEALALAHRVGAVVPRSDRTVAMANFCTYIAGELKQVSAAYPENTAALAWACRNLFEANLTVRYVLLSQANLIEWMGQALRDERDFIDGVLSIPHGSKHPQDIAILRQRRVQLDDMARRYRLDFAKPFRVGEIAKELGEASEYAAMYKLFSKYVHPTSLLVNSWYQVKADMGWTNVFLTSAQQYAADTIQRVAEDARLEHARSNVG